MGFPRPPQRLGSTPAAPATGRALLILGGARCWLAALRAREGRELKPSGRSLVAIGGLEPRSGEDLRARRRAGARPEASSENLGFRSRT